LAELGIEIRAGLHTGEVERQGRAVSGLAVHVGARAATSSVNLIMQPARFRTRIRTGGPRGLTPLANAEPAVIIAGAGDLLAQVSQAPGHTTSLAVAQGPRAFSACRVWMSTILIDYCCSRSTDNLFCSVILRVRGQ